jgi:hypothetical protein
MKYATFLLLFTIIMASFSFAQSATPEPSLEPGDQVGDVWIYPQEMAISSGDLFYSEIHANTGSQRLAAYGFGITYDSSKINIQDVDEGADGFIAAVGMGSPGYFIIQGFDTNGTGPGSDLHVVTMTYENYPDECGTTAIQVTINEMVDYYTETIGTPQGYEGTVTITGCLILGDVDSNGTIDIVDALKIAQYYVGMGSINTAAADVNCDGIITIIDALLVAQYYVTIIDGFCE